MQERLARILSERYRIEREIGRGVTGKVFLAHDLRHDRRVAIKVLYPEYARAVGGERFLREIHITAGLTHPHILTLLDSGSSGDLTWCVLPYADGGTLRQRLRERGALPVDEAVRIAGEIADALASAHRHGIVHRDVKPENILFEEDHALLADFGIARAVAGTDSATLTQAASAMGTPAYMSPEQISGSHTVTSAADQYALACVLFEMLTGRSLFQGDTGAGILSAHLAAPPADVRSLRPEVPAPLARAIGRALSKEPKDRFVDLTAFRAAFAEHEFAGDETRNVVRPRRHRLRLAVTGLTIALALVAAWKWFPRPQPVSKVRALAVLPLENVSGNANEEYFADGMTEELILELSKISALRVISRTSVMSLKGQDLPLAEIGKKLGVDTVLEGTVARGDGRLRVSLQLFQVKPEQQLWGERYDRSAEQSLELQSQIAQAVVEPVRIQMTPDEARRVRRVARVPVEAHDAVLRGRFALARLDSSGCQEAIRQFAGAASIAPGYAEAWEGLARSYWIASSAFMAPSQAMGKARGAALKALSLDPNLASAHAVLALILVGYDWKFAEADGESQKAVALGPGDADAHFSRAIVLLNIHRIAEATQEAEIACRLDPLSNYKANCRAYMSYSSGNYVDARRRYQAIAVSDSNDYVPRYSLAMIAIVAGQPEQAIQSLEVLATKDSYSQALLGYAYARCGRDAEASRMLKTLERRSRSEYISASHMALICIALDDFDQAMHWLARAYDEKDENLLVALTDPLFKPIWQDPRFVRLNNRIHGRSS